MLFTYYKCENFDMSSNAEDLLRKCETEMSKQYHMNDGIVHVKHTFAYKSRLAFKFQQENTQTLKIYFVRVSDREDKTIIRMTNRNVGNH